MRKIEINFNYSSVVMALQIALIILKITGIINMDWPLVFLPIIISFLLFIGFISIIMLIYVIAKIKE